MIIRLLINSDYNPDNSIQQRPPVATIGPQGAGASTLEQLLTCTSENSDSCLLVHITSTSSGTTRTSLISQGVDTSKLVQLLIRGRTSDN